MTKMTAKESREYADKMNGVLSDIGITLRLTDEDAIALWQFLRYGYKYSDPDIWPPGDYSEEFVTRTKSILSRLEKLTEEARQHQHLTRR